LLTVNILISTQIANIHIAKDIKGPISIDIAILRQCEGINAAIPTALGDCLSGNVVTIKGLEPQFTLPGGVTRPKGIVSIGSDGRKYRQLIKVRFSLLSAGSFLDFLYARSVR
jgi:hypothetical protein